MNKNKKTVTLNFVEAGNKTVHIYAGMLKPEHNRFDYPYRKRVYVSLPSQIQVMQDYLDDNWTINFDTTAENIWKENK